MRADKISQGARPGFTLVELLVVIILILTLAALAVAFVPRVNERRRAAQGADLLQGWLLQAKQRALRDRVPTGIRLQPGTRLPTATVPNAQFVTDLQYIQKPDDFGGGMLTLLSPTSAVVSSTAQSPVADFFNGLGPGSPTALWSVQPGDYVEIYGGGPVHQIVAVRNTPPTSLVGNTIDVSPTNPLPFVSGSTISTPQYRIIRTARIIPGEPTLQMPQNVAIDLSTNATYGSPLPNPNPWAGGIDIFFAPSGEILNTKAGMTNIILWVRDVTLDANLPGDQTLVVINVRTGLIAAHPVDTTPNPSAPPVYLSPYSFTRDGRSSGL
jgi:prepilin-type N-terminal cleavage/methylation domain-containing protein